MLASVAFAAVAALPFAFASPYYKLNRRASGISVELSREGATDVRASVLNTGAEAIQLFTSGTFLDKAPVQKLDVTKDGEAVEFTGILATYLTEDIAPEYFVTLQPGESAESLINLAALYSIDGGSYSVQMTDAFAYAPLGGSSLAGVYEFSSNAITVEIESEAASLVAQAIPVEASLEKRTRIQQCSGTQLTALTNAISRTRTLSTNAANAASGGNANKFSEYFRTTAAATRSNVAARFRSYASEASSTSSGSTTYLCVDFANVCGSGGVIAYAQPATNRMTNCPPFYRLRAVSNGCGQQSQASTVLHEFTHCLARTQDYAYGYAASTRLSAAQAYNNADTYALYADAISVGC